MKRARARPLAGVFLTLAMAAALLGGCGSAAPTPPATDASPKPGGTANIPLGAEPFSLLPYNIQDSESLQIAHQIFQGLVRYELQSNGTMRAIPDIAESWTTNKDLTVWTFKLRTGVTFQAPVRREVTASTSTRRPNSLSSPLPRSSLCNRAAATA
jgi:ABC-type transport system substrate-binding protein